MSLPPLPCTQKSDLGRHTLSATDRSITCPCANYAELQGLKHLGELNIAGNPVASLLPLATLTTLRCLRMSALPTAPAVFADSDVALKGLTNLTMLTCDMNSLDEVPPVFATFKKYARVWVGRCACVFPALAGFLRSRVRTCRLQFLCKPLAPVSTLRRHKVLKHLALSFHENRLRVLLLNKNRLKDRSLELIASVGGTLEALEMSENHLQTFSSDLGEKFPKLQLLVLRDNWLLNAEGVAKLTELEELDLAANWLESLPDLSGLPRLTVCR